MRKVTREEWERTPREYRMVKNGQRYMLVRDEERGTVLVPVEVEEPAGPCKTDIRRASKVSY